MPVLSVLMAAVSLVLMVWIAYRQHNAHHKLVDIAKSIQSRRFTKLNVYRFFGKRTSWQCHIPVMYRRKPLPLTEAGDYYALHVISTHLDDPKQTVIEFVNREDSADTSVPHSRNSIFLCSPLANRALNSLCPAYYENDDEVVEQFSLRHDLPCWFQVSDQQCCIRELKNDRTPLHSEADSAYSAAKKLVDGKDLAPTKLQRDIGILARLKRGGKTNVIIAGIHQYGTWLIADFLNELLQGKAKRGSDFFLSNDEFVAVIEGQFNQSKLRAKRTQLCGDHLWHRGKNKQYWSKIKPNYEDKVRRRGDP